LERIESVERSDNESWTRRNRKEEKRK